MEHIQWVIAHADELLATLSAILIAAAAVATWTETKRDDSVIANLQRFVKRVGQFLADRNS